MCLHVCPQPPHSLLTFISLNITLFLWQPLPLNTLIYFILRELYVLLFPVSPCDPCLCLFLLHILDFLNHPADHHLVWPDITLKSPIHFQTAPSASAYHVFNLYSRPPPHTHTLTQSNVFRIQNQLLFSPYHHTCPTLPYHLGSLHTCRLKSDPVTSPSPLGTRCSISFNLLWNSSALHSSLPPPSQKTSSAQPHNHSASTVINTIVRTLKLRGAVSIQWVLCSL